MISLLAVFVVLPVLAYFVAGMGLMFMDVSDSIPLIGLALAAVLMLGWVALIVRAIIISSGVPVTW